MAQHIEHAVETPSCEHVEHVPSGIDAVRVHAAPLQAIEDRLAADQRHLTFGGPAAHQHRNPTEFCR